MKHASSIKRYVIAVSVALSVTLLMACKKVPETSTASQRSMASTSAPKETAKIEPATASVQSEAKENVELVHVHGLSYTADGKKLMIPSHHGLAVFNGTNWSKADGPQHDYMGFSATKNAIYSSGHPAPDSGLENPFGVIKSVDGGNTWQKLGMHGESDFHILATGYESNAVYVVNHGANSKMTQDGIYASMNDGFSWQRAAAKGLKTKPITLAVHPADPKFLAVGGNEGLFLSKDGGGSFQKILSSPAVGAFFDLDGKHLWTSVVNKEAELVRGDLSGKIGAKANLRLSNNDAVVYMAQNPLNPDEYAVATLKRSVFLSQDGGESWKQIAEQGKTMPIE